MTEKSKYDVIIVGCGPGGAFLGYLLSEKGLSVLILEKKTLPRYKACGGGLTKKAVDMLPFDITSVVEDSSYTATISIDNIPVFTKTLDEPIIQMVMRDRFDHFLAKKAVGAGAILHEDSIFRSISGAAGDLTVEVLETRQSTKRYHARIVVGADGVNSKVARALGLFKKKKLMTAIEGEFVFKTADDITPFKNSVYFDFGIIPNGYGWIFPKSAHLSMGVLTISKKIQALKQYLTAYVTSKKLSDSVRTDRIKGHQIPCVPDKKTAFSGDKGLLIGDAAGLVDPVTGEGLYYAFKSAAIASEVIAKALESDYSNLEQYNLRIKDELLGDLVYARRIAYLLYHHQKFMYKILRRHGERLGEYHLEIISGKSTYKAIYKKIFNISKTLHLLLPRRSR